MCNENKQAELKLWHTGKWSMTRSFLTPPKKSRNVHNRFTSLLGFSGRDMSRHNH